MKRLLLTLILLFTTYLNFSQISTTEVKKVEEVKTIKKYDSLLNHPKFDELNLLIGQVLYIKPVEEGGFPSRESSYGGFYKDKECKKVYKRNKGSILDYSDYKSLSGKYFKILDIKKKSYKLFIFKLQNSEDEKIIYWKGENYFVEEGIDFPSFFHFDFPFITVGFYDKLKESCINQSYVMGNVSWRFWGDNIDLNTGKKVKHPLFEREEWKCIDVTVSEPNFLLSLVLENDKSEKLVVEYDRIVVNKNNKGNLDEFPDLHVFTKEISDSYELKFGEKDWDGILQEQIWIGMTKEMCKLSIGNPIKINETIRSSGKFDQWVYEDKYVYFSDGLLSSLQD